MHDAQRDSNDSPAGDWRADPAPHRAALVVVLLVAVVIRVLHMGQPMRLDEARTFLDYAIRPLPDALSNYNIPNNHLLHTLLVWLSIRVFGDAEWAVRLPAFIAGVLVVPATYVLARELAGRGAALIASALVAALPGLILYSTNARGYSMVVLAFVVLLILADRLADEETPARWLAYGAVVTLGFATVPAMLYPAGAASLWLFVEHARRHGVPSALRFALRLGGVLAVAGAIAAVAYLPAIRRFGVGAITDNKFVTPYTWDQFVASLPRFAVRLRHTIGLGIRNYLMLALVLCGAIPLVVRGRNRGKLFTLAATASLWCVVLLVFTRRAPPPRVWLFLAPLFCTYAAIGIAWLLSRLASRIRLSVPQVTAAAALLIAVGLSASTLRSRAVFDNNESVQLQAGPDIARYLLAEAQPGDRVIVSNMVSPEVDYYTYTLGARRFADLEAPSRSARMLLILNELESQTTATVQTERPDVDWTRFESPVQVRKFRSATVWAAARRAP